MKTWQFYLRLFRFQPLMYTINLIGIVGAFLLEMVPGLAVYASGTILLGLPVWAVALVEGLLIVANYSDHLDIRLPPRAGRWISRVFVTPDIHRVHHSAARAQADSNYGSILILWDRLFGSYRRPEAETITRYGLDEVGTERANSLWSQLALPFVRTEIRPDPPETQPRSRRARRPHSRLP